VSTKFDIHVVKSVLRAGADPGGGRTLLLLKILILILISALSTGFGAQRVPQVEQEMLVLLEYLSSPPVLVG
jgi:hypothetical protein